MRQIGTRKGRERFGRFRIEGIRVVERAIRAGVTLDGVIVGESFAKSETKRERALLQAIEQAATLCVVDDDAVRSILGGRKLGDIVAAVQFTALSSLREVLLPSSTRLLLGIVDVVEPGNVGAMIRTAHGMGASAVLTCGASDPFHPKAVRTAMGSLFRLPLLQFDSATDMLTSLHESNVATVATLASGGIPLPQFERKSENLCILIGNEFEGLAAEIAAQATYHTTIPMAQSIDSFSVSAAAAICLYALTV